MCVSGLILYFSDCDLTLAYYSLRRKNLHVLKGKVVWITGASSGIGEALAYTLAGLGAKLILSARREAELMKVLKKCKDVSPEDYKNSHIVLVLDVLKCDSHIEYVNLVLKRYGRVDYLVNNAGRSQRAADIDTQLEVIRLLLETNTIGTISLTKALMPHMIKQQKGCVVFISSIAGKLGAPGSAGYSASKHALQGYLDALRIEVANDGIDVLSICPGPVHSSFMRDVLGTSLEKEAIVKEDGTQGKRIPVNRCAYLIAITMANRLEEVWISFHPILFFTYVSQYAPVLAKKLGKKIGGSRVKAIKSGQKDIDSGFFKK